MRRLCRPLCLLLCLLLLSAPVAFADDAPFSVTVHVGGGSFFVRAYADSYYNNLYLSLSDLSAALSGTGRQFRFSLTSTPSDGDVFSLTSGLPAEAPSRGAEGTAETVTALYPYRNRLFQDGRELKYYTHRQGNELYMSLTDVQLLLGVTIERSAEGGLRLYPERPFVPDPSALAAAGYLDAVDAVLVGDADTGEILYARHGGDPYPVASLSKLMGYLLLAEAANDGRVHLNDAVPISETAAALSRSVNGMIELHAGQTVPFTELLDAMLISSSNESALALAEYLSGSEASFVDAMNRRAAELGMLSTVYRSCCGLPVYTDSAIPAKRQNVSSASDLFLLCRHLLARYPALLDRTSKTYVILPDMGNYVSANSNPMVFNVPGANGLKTGNTDRAGYCLISTLPVAAEGATHTVVAIVLGAETPIIRNQLSQMLLLWAQRRGG